MSVEHTVTVLSMIDVVYVIGQLAVGGTETQLLALARNLDRGRFRPHVACLSDDAELADQFREAGCPVHVASPDLNRFQRLQWLLSVLRMIRPAIVQAIGYAWYWGIPSAVLSRVPAIIASERGIPYWKTSRHRLLDRWLLRRASLVLVNADAVKRHVIQDLGVRPDACCVIPNGIDLEAFEDTAEIGLRGDIPIEASFDRPVVCAVGNLKPEKGIDTLLTACVTIREQSGSEVPQLWVVGDGIMRPQLEALSRELGRPESTVFWGQRDDVPAVLGHATVGVLASRTEGLPNVVLEYMAGGLPVVATAVAGTPELVVDGETGFLVPPDAPDCLAEAILRLLHDPCLARRMGQAGRSRVEQQFSLERMVQETEAAYEFVLDECSS